MFMQHKFSETDKMSDLINENHSLLLVISRFGLSLGFGDQSVKEVCAGNGIDCRTFLTVVNFLTEANFEVEHDFEGISIVSIINYLKNAHVYFLEFKLPQIRNRLIEAVSSQEQNRPYLAVFLKFFDEYVSEVRKHMEYEDKIAFPYVIRLLNGEPGLTYNITVFRHHHDEIESKLVELKNLLIKYYPDKGNNPLLTEVLFDIFSCEMDLTSHSQVEEFIFIPAVEAVERKHNLRK